MPDSPTALDLSRTVRVQIAPGQPVARGGPNSFAASVATSLIGAYFEITLHSCGAPDPETGFVDNIYEMDRVVREVLAPRIAEAMLPPGTTPTQLLIDCLPDLQDQLESRLSRIDWTLSPSLHLSLETDDMTTVLLSQAYQFAASHRLHNPELDEDGNRALFGKCANPNGHGHNYRLEVTVAVPLSGEGAGFSALDLDALVHEHVVDQYDHTYLNLDVADFRDQNPTVENITVTCHDKLVGPLADRDVSLKHVRLWETDKTCCTYPAS